MEPAPGRLGPKNPTQFPRRLVTLTGQPPTKPPGDARPFLTASFNKGAVTKEELTHDVCRPDSSRRPIRRVCCRLRPVPEAAMPVTPEQMAIAILVGWLLSHLDPG